MASITMNKNIACLKTTVVPSIFEFYNVTRVCLAGFLFEIWVLLFHENVCSIGTSQLKDPQFSPQLGLLPHVGFLLVSLCCPKTCI